MRQHKIYLAIFFMLLGAAFLYFSKNQPHTALLSLITTPQNQNLTNNPSNLDRPSNTIDTTKVTAAPDSILPANNDLVQQKYSIIFSGLQLTPKIKNELNRLLSIRETILAKNIFTPGVNDAEIEESLRVRELDVSNLDKEISNILGDENAAKYELLKDSNYEQALLNEFYQLASMDNYPAEKKFSMLLDKLEEKKQINTFIAIANKDIENTAPANRPSFIALLKTNLENAQTVYLEKAKIGLSGEQFEALQLYEQQLSSEKWQDFISSLQ